MKALLTDLAEFISREAQANSWKACLGGCGVITATSLFQMSSCPFFSALDLPTPRMIEDPRCHYPSLPLTTFRLLFFLFLLPFLPRMNHDQTPMLSTENQVFHFLPAKAVELLLVILTLLQHLLVSIFKSVKSHIENVIAQLLQRLLVIQFVTVQGLLALFRLPFLQC